MEQKKETFGWIKGLLNNKLLLKWVTKFSADNLLDTNKLAKEKFNIKTEDDSLSIADTTATKLLVTNSKFNGEEIARFNLNQLKELIDLAGTSGEVIIPKSELNEMVAEVNGSIVVVCPLPKQDGKRKNDN